MLHYRLSKA